MLTSDNNALIFYIFLQYSDIEKTPENDLPLPIKVARGTSYALWSLAKSKKNKIYIQKAGGFSLLVKLVRTKNISVIIPAIGTLQVRSHATLSHLVIE